MRETASWRKSLARSLRAEWPEDLLGFGPADLCDVELGLQLLRTLVPDEPATALWALLAGYPFPVPVAQEWTDGERDMLATARYLLGRFRGPARWRRALEH